MALKTLLCGGAIAALTLIASAAQATTPITAQVNTTVFVRTTGSDLQVGRSMEFASGLPQGDLHAHSDRSTTSAGGSAAATSTIAAHWDSAAKGNVHASLGYDVQIPKGSLETSQVLLSDAFTGGGPAWEYNFSIDRDSLFNLDFLVAGTMGSELGKWSLMFEDLSGPVEAILLSADLFDTGSASGALSRRLAAGHSYRLQLINYDGGTFGGAAFAGPLDLDAHAHEDSQFNWSIDPLSGAGGVPEPSTWTIAILGFGLTGATLRRRRMVAAA